MKIFQRAIWALMLASLALATCGAPPPPEDPDALIPATISVIGDANVGKLLYSSQGCAMCHAVTTQKLVGPGLAGVMTAGGPTYPEGIEYGYALPNGSPRTEENLAAWIQRGGRGQIGVMPGRRLDEQDIADLLAYLRTLEK
jgi:cytochrome c